MAYNGTKRKVFLSFFQSDRREVDQFVARWSTRDGVFTPKAIGVSNNDDFINSDNTDYVMSQIRRKYLGDSSVTIVLVGNCTHSRRYVDWEIKSSLTQGASAPNGLIAILLPSQGTSAHLPPRLKDNWNEDNRNSYARYYSSPTSADQLGIWIEDAYAARISRAKFIANSQQMMKYNAKCRIHGVTH